MQEIYEKAIRDDNEEFMPKIGFLTSGAVEYGKLIFRTLILLNGGGLLLIPSLFGTIEGITPDQLLYAAKCFIVGVASVGVSIYISHLNSYFSRAAWKL